MRNAQGNYRTDRTKCPNDLKRAKRCQGCCRRRHGGTVETNGVGEVLRLTIDPQLIERQEREIIEDLVPAAVNQAVQKARQAQAEYMQSMTEGVSLPGLQDAISKLTNLNS